MSIEGCAYESAGEHAAMKGEASDALHNDCGCKKDGDVAGQICQHIVHLVLKVVGRDQQAAGGKAGGEQLADNALALGDEVQILGTKLTGAESGISQVGVISEERMGCEIRDFKMNNGGH